MTDAGLSTNGLKADLVARLEEHEAAQDVDKDGDRVASEVADTGQVQAPVQPDEPMEARSTDLGDGKPSQEDRDEENVGAIAEIIQSGKPSPGEKATSNDTAKQETSPASAVDQPNVARPESPNEGISAQWLAAQELTENLNQVAGHPGSIRSLVGPSGQALIVKRSLASEVSFYQKISTPGQIDTENPKQSERRRALSRDWMPKYYGSIAGESESRPSVALEDLLAPFESPNVLDVKLGTQLWDEADASEEKKQRMEQASKDTTSYETGMRLTGWRTWDATEKKFHTVGKTFGKHISKDQIPLGILSFFGLLRGESKQRFEETQSACSVERDENGNLTTAVAQEELAGSSPIAKQDTSPLLDSQAMFTLIERHLMPQLVRLTSLLSSLEVRIRGGSLLILFEGSAEELQRRLHTRKPRDDDSNLPALTIRLIDFAHARLVPGEGPDEGVLKGLRTLQEILRTEVLRTEDTVALSRLEQNDVRKLRPSRALRIEGLVRPLHFNSFRERCLEIANEGVETEEKLDEAYGENGVWLDNVKSSGWVVFNRVAAARRLFDSCNEKPFPTAESFRTPVRMYFVPVDLVAGLIEKEQREWQEKKTKTQIYVRLPREGEDWDIVFSTRNNAAEQRLQQQRLKQEKKERERKRKESTHSHEVYRDATKRRPDRGPGPVQTSIRGVAAGKPMGHGRALADRMGRHGQSAYGWHADEKHNAYNSPQIFDDSPSRPPLPQAAAVDLDPRPTLRLEQEHAWHPRRSEYTRSDSATPSGAYPPRSNVARRYAPPNAETRQREFTSSFQGEIRGQGPSKETTSRYAADAYDHTSTRRRASPGWMDRPEERGQPGVPASVPSRREDEPEAPVRSAESERRRWDHHPKRERSEEEYDRRHHYGSRTGGSDRAGYSHTYREPYAERSESGYRHNGHNGRFDAGPPPTRSHHEDRYYGRQADGYGWGASKRRRD